jgi:sulfane dehydrogenase subunit SoxC
MNSPPRIKPERTTQVTPASDTAELPSSGRRHFLRKGAAMAGTALAGGAVGASVAHAAPLEVAEVSKSMGKPIPATEYGVPSKFEKNYVRVRTNVFVNRQNHSDWSFTPLQYQQGIMTPNGVVYERHHNGTPDINPDTHKLVIHGMVKQPLVFTMNDIMRYPSVSKFYFMECSGNGLTDWTKPASTTVQQTHGLLSCGQWVGVPFSTLLDEAGLAPGAKWLLVEGADGVGHTRSIPLEKAMSDGLIVYALNGEMLRPENGYPLRAFFPGWEGNVNVKWLRRIKVGDQPWHFRSETARYTDPMPDGKWRQFSMEMDTKSVITSPSGGQKLAGAGPYEIRGFAWSGRGKIEKVDVSVDGGKNWREAALEPPVLDKCLTTFKAPWNWDGRLAILQSRALDSNGYVQPTVQEIGAHRGIHPYAFVQHHNGIQSWAVTEKGEVSNVIAS